MLAKHLFKFCLFMFSLLLNFTSDRQRNFRNKNMVDVMILKKSGNLQRKIRRLISITFVETFNVLRNLNK